ncbi:MAG: SpoIIE family protein phosphatase [Spirochaetes bacterium]|nr:SpoIIE family protein phosphatase [Spirochaetota bacterium]
MYRKIIVIVVIFVVSIVLFVSCHNKRNVHKPKAIEGVLDLRNWDESSNQVLSLDGDWEFYWNQLIEPSRFTKKIKPFTYIEVPKAWNKQSNFRYSFPAFGYATYRLHIIHDVKYVGQIKTIIMPYVHSAYTLWINGKIVSKNGTVGSSKASMVPFQLPVVTQFVIDSTVTEVVLHISNFQQRTGGILRSIKYGNYDIINKQYELDLFITLFVSASLFVILLYHIGLFVVNKGYKPNLYFAFFCAIIGLRLLLTDEKLFVKMFPSLPWDIYLRMEYCTILLGIISFAYFINGLYPKKVNAVILRVITIYFSFFVLFVLIVPITYVSYSLILIQIGLLLSAVYFLFVLIKVTSIELPNSIIYFSGYIILFLTLVNDILYTQQLINSIYLFELGLLVFVFTQSLAALEESIKIQNRLITINSELEIARRIQKTILPETTPSTTSIHVEACYIPMDEIGGDFYHFYELNEDKIGIIIADVTGHGIPASLIASTVNIAFSLQRNHADNPAAVLANMNNILYGKTGEQPITALYTYVDASQKVVKFSRAGHPLPLILQGSTGKVIEIDVPGKILGVFKTIKNKITSYKISSTDRIILYTDGITEIRNSRNQIFGIERFISCIEKNHTKSTRDLIDSIVDTVIQWAGSKDKITDDITLVIVDIK